MLDNYLSVCPVIQAEAVERLKDPQWPKISIAINNYNYEHFVERTILSALNQTYPNVEVILVDDGSTDNSLEIMRRYENRAQVIAKINGGQASAYLAGIGASTGDYVILLDSDDTLCADAAAQIARHAAPGVSKIQWSVDWIDADDRKLGRKWPAFPMRSGNLMPEMFDHLVYVSPPGSANAYSRWFLSSIKDRIDPTAWRRACDSFLITMSALYGEIRSIDQTLGNYRVHGKNVSNAGLLGRDNLLQYRIRMMVNHALDLEVRLHIARSAGFALDRPLSDNLITNAKARFYSYRVAPGDHPFKNDDRLNLLIRALRCCWVDTGPSAGRRIVSLVGFMAMAILPVTLVKRLPIWRRWP